MKKGIGLSFFMAVAGCNILPGPELRNGFPAEISVSVLYEDGTENSNVWTSCQTAFVGATTSGRLGGMFVREIPIDQITVTVEGKIVHTFDRSAIEELLLKAEDVRKDTGGYPIIWVLEPSGVRFSNQRECQISEKLPQPEAADSGDRRLSPTNRRTEQTHIPFYSG